MKELRFFFVYVLDCAALLYCAHLEHRSSFFTWTAIEFDFYFVGIFV